MTNDEPIPKPQRKLSRYVHNRIEHNKNFLCLITGPTGTGKSYSALSWAEELDPAFDVSRVVFTVKEFLQLLVKGDLPKGAVILLDEVGVAANSRQFMSKINRSLHFVAQTVRSYNNPIVFVTTPHGGFLDAGVRKLMHMHVECIGIDHKSSKVRTKPKSIQINQVTGQAYYKYLRVKHPLYNKHVPLTRSGFGLPSKALRLAYEEKKLAYQTALYNDLLNSFDADEAKERSKSTATVVTERQGELLEHLKSGMTLTQAAEKMGTSRENVSQLKKSLSKRGCVFKPRKNGVRTIGYTVIEPLGGIK